MKHVYLDYFGTTVGGEQFLSRDPPTCTSALDRPIALAVVVAIVVAGYARAGAKPARLALALAGGVPGVPVLDLAGYAQFGLAAETRGRVPPAVGLVVLAGYERTLRLLAVGVVFVAAAVLLPGLAGVVSSAVVLLAVAFVVVAGPAKGRSRPAAAIG